MNFYPFNIGDYSAATRHLSWDEDLAYRRLIDVYYTREQPIPLDRRQVYRLVLASSDDQRAAVDAVLGEFFFESERGLINHRCEEEISKASSKRDKASQSAKARWSNATDKDNALPTQSERKADASINDCECIENASVGNAPNPNPNPNINSSAPEKRVAKKSTQIPADFYPNETGVTYTETRRLSLAVELEAFRNWHTAKGSTMKDWQACWRTWCDKAVDFGRAGKVPLPADNGKPELPEFMRGAI